jgi:hypothetical protein
MIIGINGKIGSGKDTVGKIIQYLCCTPKSVEDFEHMKKFILDDTHKSNLDLASDYEIRKFAGKLKQVASLLTGIPIDSFEDQEFKKSYLGSEWGTVKTNPLNSIPVFKNVGFNQLMSVRELLQKLGTEAMRDGLHVNTWVNALFADYKEHKPPKGDTFDYAHTECIDCKKRFSGYKRQFICNDCYDSHNWYPNWIITDMRFPNEMEAVVERKGITIRVKRTPRTVINGVIYLIGADGLVEHPSETGLDNETFKYELDNNGTIEELIEKVREILTIEKII